MSSIEEIDALDADKLAEDNLDPFGRAYYAFSTLLRTPELLSQETPEAPRRPAGASG
jgi:hypothetical protein